MNCTHISYSNMCGVFVFILEDDDGAEPDLLLNLLNEGAVHFLN